jgi:hypothetical protein
MRFWNRLFPTSSASPLPSPSSVKAQALLCHWLSVCTAISENFSVFWVASFRLRQHLRRIEADHAGENVQHSHFQCLHTFFFLLLLFWFAVHFFFTEIISSFEFTFCRFYQLCRSSRFGSLPSSLLLTRHSLIASLNASFVSIGSTPITAIVTNI